VSPMKASFGKLMMWFFLLSDAFTFSGLLVAYGTSRFKTSAYEGAVDQFVPSTEYWPIPEMIFDAFPLLHGIHAPLAFVGLMTFILIMSSVTMVLAVEAGHRMDKVAVEKWMMWTILGGVTFLGCQAWEWSHFIHGSGKEGWGLGMAPNGADFLGASMYANEYGPQNFSQYFFFITGFHGTHVFSGVVLNILVFYWVAVGKYERSGDYEMVEKVGLYWHFVDLVWVFVFTFFYLL
ncbi:MAG: cytochrome c oxidase subunit 3, partial [Cyclobacteriaceae bacterium]